MKSMLMAIMAVAVAMTFSAPSFAGDEKSEKKDEKKGGYVFVYGDDDKKDKKDTSIRSVMKRRTVSKRDGSRVSDRTRYT
jgi:hypothetical protein